MGESYKKVYVSSPQLSRI